LLRHCLEGGFIRPSRHFREELANEGLDLLDAFHVLRTGNIFNPPELDVRFNDWTYRMEGSTPDGMRLAIVFCFKEQETGFLITVFSIR
jgi:hypothetical protein